MIQVEHKISKKIDREFPIGLTVEHINSDPLYHRCDTRDITKDHNLRIIHKITDDSPSVQLLPHPISTIRIHTIWSMDKTLILHDEFKNLWN